VTSSFGNFGFGVDGFGLDAPGGPISTTTLANLFQMLSYGELSNLSMSNDGTKDASGSITAAAQPRIVLYANEGLRRLYAKFILLEQDVILQMQTSMTYYNLTSPYAATYIPTGPADNQPVRYLLDSPGKPFLADIIKILAVFDYQGRKLALNDDGDNHSVFTPQANRLQIPYPIDQQMIDVVYQARHPKLDGTLSAQINLPEILFSALTAYIAYKVFSHMNTADSTTKAQEHLIVYEQICADCVENDLVNASISTSNERFHARGWR
jgi:hypothetical protein